MSVYACSDLHGQWDLFEELMTYINPDDKVYFLGDAIDRGLFGWNICKTIINDSRFTYIMGNHEDMMLKCLSAITPKNYDDYYCYNSDMQLWFWNGGENTYDGFFYDTENTVEDKIDILKRLKRLNYFDTYINKHRDVIYLTHAGFEPDFLREDRVTKEDFLWDRSHYIADDFYGLDNEIVIHGHTPNPHLVNEINWHKKEEDRYNYQPGDGAFWYAGGHKCCIDCGAHYTGTTVLLNLDTFEEIKIGEPINGTK